MHPRLRNLLAKLLATAGYELHPALPEATLEPLNLLLAYYDARGEMITVLQVGACDGAQNDPVRHQVVKGLTRAILIEPNPVAFARLQKTYEGLANVTLLQTAIGPTDGVAHLYRVRTDVADHQAELFLQIASFDKEHLRRHGKTDDQIEQITVPSRTLGSLVAGLGLPKIDLLQIDAEGFDAEIVRMALKMPVKPDCINFEHVHLKKQDRRPLYAELSAAGYLLCHDQWNVLAMQTAVIEEMGRAPTMVLA
ncbi:MAG TPA: FkbM family methyltransferase [Candidatus Methylacidiphilales bacterium]|jgi:FkbM family methyltransferase|nr:FkbM family methyltransferase [Candidatus Methylacidiphilales bacterium]